MATMAFDSLRYARRLREVGVPEPQAEVQAELMAEAFGFYAENILTRDHFTDVLNARFAEQETKLDQRLAQLDAKFDKRFVEQEINLERRFSSIDQRFAQQEANLEQRFSSIDQRLSRQDRTLSLHTWMLGLVVIVLVIPQLQAWLT